MSVDQMATNAVPHQNTGDIDLTGLDPETAADVLTTEMQAELTRMNSDQVAEKIGGILEQLGETDETSGQPCSMQPA